MLSFQETIRCVSSSRHTNVHISFLITSRGTNILLNSLLFKHFGGRFGNLRREFLDSLIIQVDHRPGGGHITAPQKKKSFK